jgi:hypothetical protein
MTKINFSLDDYHCAKIIVIVSLNQKFQTDGIADYRHGDSRK